MLWDRLFWGAWRWRFCLISFLLWGFSDLYFFFFWHSKQDSFFFSQVTFPIPRCCAVCLFQLSLRRSPSFPDLNSLLCGVLMQELLYCSSRVFFPNASFAIVTHDESCLFTLCDTRLIFTQLHTQIVFHLPSLFQYFLHYLATSQGFQIVARRGITRGARRGERDHRSRDYFPTQNLSKPQSQHCSQWL